MSAAKPAKFYEMPEVIERCAHIARSYESLVGVPLLRGTFTSAAKLARDLYDAPFVLVSHDALPDPIFRFANKAALGLWDMPPEKFIGLPSRLSAEPGEREARERFLEEVRAKGYTLNYEGIRITRNGGRFRIRDVHLWNVTNGGNDYIGQAAKFSDWQFL
jgi:MEKHLA domain